MLRAYVALRVRCRHAADRGQGSLEYIGMLAVAALLAVGVLQAVQSADLGGYFTSLIRKVTGGGGAGGGSPTGPGTPGGG